MNNEHNMDAVFQALANESRRHMLDIVQERAGIGVGELAREFDVSRIAVMKHLRVLEQAGLVISEKVGRTRRLYFNAIPIQMVYDRWTSEYSAYWGGEVTKLKYRAERRAQAETKYKKKRGK